MTFSQEEQLRGAFESDTTWLKEIIKFPIGFAPEITYEGYEDLRFAKSWRDKEHPDFWCYTFVWHVKGIQKPSKKEFEHQLKSYYDGLMTAVNKKKDYIIPETKVRLISNVNDETNNGIIGEIRVYDSFNTENVITLNVQIKSYFCENKQETMMVFRLSPQAFDGPIWERFNDIKIRTDICD